MVADGLTHPAIAHKAPFDLIVANILVFLHELSLDPYSLNHFVGVYSLRPYLFHLENVLTSMFLHANWFHLAGNMLFLWVFGENVEDILGHWKFLIFYLLCGLAAAGAQVAIDPMSRIPMVGASGAIAGVMGAYRVTFPHSRVVMLFFMLFIFSIFLAMAECNNSALDGIGILAAIASSMAGVGPAFSSIWASYASSGMRTAV